VLLVADTLLAEVFFPDGDLPFAFAVRAP
jgi:hypothetical protein